MEMQLAAVLAMLALGGALVVLFFVKCVKELDDAVEALLQLRADVLRQLDGAPEPGQPRAWLRRVQDAQDEVASIKIQEQGAVLLEAAAAPPARGAGAPARDGVRQVARPGLGGRRAVAGGGERGGTQARGGKWGRRRGDGARQVGEGRWRGEAEQGEPRRVARACQERGSHRDKQQGQAATLSAGSWFLGFVYPPPSPPRLARRLPQHGPTAALSSCVAPAGRLPCSVVAPGPARRVVQPASRMPSDPAGSCPVRGSRLLRPHAGSADCHPGTFNHPPAGSAFARPPRPLRPANSGPLLTAPGRCRAGSATPGEGGVGAASDRASSPLRPHELCAVGVGWRKERKERREEREGRERGCQVGLRMQKAIAGVPSCPPRGWVWGGRAGGKYRQNR
uniref:Uncharacterized protein n=1 Tax=Aegilops tauschii subsp. strangulata TaxID=200361 RepID=A0A453M070_AEGTS